VQLKRITTWQYQPRPRVFHLYFNAFFLRKLEPRQFGVEAKELEEITDI
jgi:hypothetical protein